MLLVYAALGKLNVNGPVNQAVQAPAGALVVIETPADEPYTIAGSAFTAVALFKATAYL